MSEASALWFQAQEQAVIRSEALPEATEGWCEIRTQFSALSPGTERLVYTARVPPELAEAMRCPYMGGAFPFPVKYGYSLVGTVNAGPADWLGRAVHVLHPHQDRCVVRCEDVYALPPDVPPERATLASNLETAVNVLWDAQVALGERVLVVGFGIVGSLVARLLSIIPGVQLEVVDAAPAKQRTAAEMGFRSSSSVDALAPSFDLAIHASASSEGLQVALDHVGFEGRVVELSWYGTRPVTVQLGGTFHNQRKRIISSQVSTIAPAQRPRWDNRRRKALVFDLLRRPEFDAHITHRVAFSDLPQVFQRLAHPPTEGLAYLVDYGNEG
jgi:threonine dehydrogenase-like Zn-dependent dehydrogenase